MDLVDNKEKTDAMRRRAKELVSQMTLEEKVFQTLHSAPAVERLHIKGYDWWNEALHGVARAGTATVFPQAIGLAATFDEDLIEDVADAISTEGRAKFNMQQESEDTGRYKGLTFWAPNINIFRDPRWGRGHETYGEDPYLTSRMGIRFIRGIQGHDENYLKAAACVKHFAVHSGPENLRHSFNAEVSKKDLFETYLPAFQACIQQANVEAVMGAYNRTNGEPCCGSPTLLQDILRKKWHFQGHVVSDCWAVRDFHEHHHVTDTPVESAALAMNSGCDLNCGNMFYYLLEAVRSGKVQETRLDEAVTNLFTTRMKLGVFDDKGDNPYDKIPYEVVDAKEMQDLNLRAATQSLVLLKNKDHILPLNPDRIKTLGIIGPNANSRKALVGNYEGTASRYITVTEGIQDLLGDKTRVLVSGGCHLYKDDWKNDRSSEVRGICKASDVVIVCLGLDAGIEGEQGDAGNDFASGDKRDLSLPGKQEEILRIAKESGKPVILLLLSGSALAVTWAQEHVDAIMQCWYPGAQGGKAIANVLFGISNPQGRLPVTFYRTTEELPAFTDYSMKKRTYRFMRQDALYPFGFGLGYSRFEYTGVKMDRSIVAKDGLDCRFTLHNTGTCDDTEIVQVYVKAQSENTPNPQLKAFKRVAVRQGEKIHMTMHLPLSAFVLINEDGEEYFYDGEYAVYIGGSQPDGRSIVLKGQSPACSKVTVQEELTRGRNTSTKR